MAGKLRFLHASDFWLDDPIGSLGEVPDMLKHRLIDAPLLAFERCIEAAISEQVDFVLLAGNVLQLPECGPRIYSTLLEGLSRLEKNGIAVYWASGEQDRLEDWPRIIDLPSNVHLFDGTMVEHVYHERAGQRVALILGASPTERKIDPSEFTCIDPDAFPIALCNGELELEELAEDSVTYWALGGQAKRNVISKTVPLAIYPGATQARGFDQPGAHGANLVMVDIDGQIQVKPIATDVVRFVRKQIVVDHFSDIEQIKETMGEAAIELASKLVRQTVVVEWTLECQSMAFRELNSRAVIGPLVAWLREEFGQEENGVWTTEVQVIHSGAVPESWYEEDTILGDFLREFQKLQKAGELNLDLTDQIPQKLRDRGAPIIDRLDTVDDQRTLAEAQSIAIDLLTGS